MRRILRALITMVAAASAAATIYLVLTLPPRAVDLGHPLPSTYATGVYHIHSARSDGTGSVDDIASAASRAGLAFAIITDHGDGTRPPDAPVYRHGVLCIDAVEVSTTAGHVVALGLTRPTAYPLAGTARDVIDDIHRLGGVAVAAHPDSPNPDLRWRGSLDGIDGIEWINADSEWRDERPWRLLATALRSVVRPAEAVAVFFNRPTDSLARLDAGSRNRALFALAAVDAHARIGWDEGGAAGRRRALAWPTYAQMFRTLAQTVKLEAPLSGDAATDAARVLAAIKAGRSFSIVRAYAGPAAIEFQAQPEGESMIRFSAAVPQAPGATLTLLRDGRQVASGRGRIELRTPVPGVYRAEAAWPGAAAPWLVSSPITLGVPSTEATETGLSGGAMMGDFALPLDQNWGVERDALSTGTLSARNGVLEFRFGLGSGIAKSQYAAAVARVDSSGGVGRIRFRARANRPMRLSLQVRLPGTADSQRWRRSVFVGATDTVVDVALSEFEPADFEATRRPNVSPVLGVLFVVDTLNTKPATQGTIWISSVTLARQEP